MNAWVRQAHQDVAAARRILGNDARVALFAVWSMPVADRKETFRRLWRCSMPLKHRA